MKSVKVEYGQTLIDICVQELGDATRVFEVAELNNTNITADIDPGTMIIVPDFAPKKANIVKLFSNPSIKPASANADNENEEGIEIWAIEDDFEVS